MSCDFCEKEVLPEVLKKYEEYIGEDATLLDLIDKWDALPQVKNDNRSKYVEVIGCFFPNSPDDTRLLPGPSYRKFLERSYEHVKQSHPHTQPKPSTSVKRTSRITQILLNTSAAPPVKKLVLSTPPEPSKSGVSKQRTLTLNFGKKVSHIPITNFVLGQSRSLKEESKYSRERFGKAHCLVTVHQGVNQKIRMNPSLATTNWQSHQWRTNICSRNSVLRTKVTQKL